MTTETDAAATIGDLAGDAVVTERVGVVGAVSVHAARTATDASVKVSGLRMRAPNEAVVGVSADEGGGERNYVAAGFLRKECERSTRTGKSRLSDATPDQRAHYEIFGDGTGIRWPDIDEDISVRGMLEGAPARRPAR